MQRWLWVLFVILWGYQMSPVSGQTVWTLRSAMPTARTSICATVLDGKIYVIGGRDRNGRIVGVVERYNPSTDTWETGLPHLKRERENAAAVVFQEKVFVLGGRGDEDEVLKKVEVFNASANEWQQFRDLKEEREGLTAVVLQGQLFAVGGFGGSDDDSDDDSDDNSERFLDNVEYYDESRERWRTVSDWQLEFARASFATVAFEDTAFSIAGFSSLGPLAVVQRYHPAVGTSSRNDLLTARGGLAAAASATEIFVIGGRNPGDQVIASVEFFRPAENAWDVGSPLNQAREAFVALAVDGKVYVIGGQGADGQVLASVEVAKTSDIVTSVRARASQHPARFGLEQNYPNPFNPETRIGFRIAASRDRVTLKVYNVQGGVVKTLVDDQFSPGNYQVLWDGTDQHGQPVASGIYFSKLTNGFRSESRKMVLVR